ncbi:MAG: MAPEG family protein [Pseudomonadota bacterium]
MTPPLVAALYAGLNGLILVWLVYEVVKRRRDGSIVLGDGGDPEMTKAIRGHANAAETMPMALVMLTLAELIGAPTVALHAAGAVFTVGRLLHALHFTGRASARFRMYGMASSLTAMGVLALGLVAHAIVG